jgi:hypothetical protein
MSICWFVSVFVTFQFVDIFLIKTFSLYIIKIKKLKKKSNVEKLESYAQLSKFQQQNFDEFRH